MIPVGFRHPSLKFIDNHSTFRDFANNIVLYMPLGIALSGTSLLRAFLWGLFLATGAEVWQLGCLDRIPSLMDVAGNACGAVVGYLAAAVFARVTGYDPKTLRISRPTCGRGHSDRHIGNYPDPPPSHGLRSLKLESTVSPGDRE